MGSTSVPFFVPNVAALSFNTRPANTNYVDSAVTASYNLIKPYFGDTPPSSTAGYLYWFNTTDGQLYIYYQSAWVTTANFSGGNGYVPTTGGVITGNLSVQGTITLVGGTIDNTVIGGTTPLAGSFTTMTAQSISGLQTALSIAQGGTGAKTAAAALTALGAAANGNNNDITTLSALTTIINRPTIAGNTPFDTGNVTISKVTNGYLKLPNGFIIQWGIAGGTTNVYQGTSFNTAFPNSCFMVTGSSSYNPGSNTAQAVVVSCFNPTTTGFNWSSRYYNGGFSQDNNSLFWIAIGY